MINRKESSATKRARERAYFNKGSEWQCTFETKPASGLTLEEGVHRRDPSSVIFHDKFYYTYYTKSYGSHTGFGSGDLNNKVFQWDMSEIWYATSVDGYVWEEKGVAIQRGPHGNYDDRSVFTPEILASNGLFYLVYQTVQYPYLRRSKEHIALAFSDSPAGPWEKLDRPILSPADNGIWLGDEDNRLSVVSKGDFDSLKVHDPCLFHYQGKYYLYYKGETMGEEIQMGGRETKWGVAISDHPTGPYVKSEYNPITNSGHETCLWKYKSGIAAILRTDGVEKNTVQYAEDGINFDIVAVINNPPEAPGPFRSDDVSEPLKGMEWGLSHDVTSNWNYILRFDINYTQRYMYNKKLKNQ
ncbi:glycoside hydrolase family 117 protein [Paenibacillus sp. strain BS8-2]